MGRHKGIEKRSYIPRQQNYDPRTDPFMRMLSRQRDQSDQTLEEFLGPEKYQELKNKNKLT